MEKKNGQEMKKDLDNYILKQKNLINKIDKKFDLILTDYTEYLTEDHKAYLQHVSIYDLPVERKLEVIMGAEANYIKINGNQVEMFN